MIKGTYKSERKETNSLIGYGNSKVLKFLFFFFSLSIQIKSIRVSK